MAHVPPLIQGSTLTYRQDRQEHTLLIHTYSPHRLRGLFEPQSIALIGASDKSGWSWSVHDNLVGSHFGGRVYYVNPRSATVHGQPAVSRLADIGKPVDLAFVMVPTAAVMPVLQEMVEADIHNAVILTAGFGELEAEGQQRQQELIEFARDHDLALLGPNCMGFINVTHNVVAMPTPYPPIAPGGVALISESGALTSSMLNFAYAQNVGLRALISTGNEAVVSVSDAIGYFVEDEATTVIALFLESVRTPEHFLQVARQALERGKPIVALKVGRSPLSATMAKAHTGALAGDDRIVDAVFRQTGIIRVTSLEEMIITAGVLAQTGVLPGNRLGFVGVSGGACDIAADIAAQEGIVFPTFSEETRQVLQALVPVPGTAHNPFDTTGQVVINRELFGSALVQIGKDPHIDVLACSLFLPTHYDSTSVRERHTNTLTRLAVASQSLSRPVYILDHLSLEVPPEARHLVNHPGLRLLPGGLDRGLTALGKAMWWSEHVRRAQSHNTAQNTAAPVKVDVTGHGTWSEVQAQALLKQHEIPTIPAILATDTQQVVDAARALGWPVVLKVASPDILHKSDIGGVRLNLHDEDDVREAFAQIMEAARTVTPPPRLEGVLVSPMRKGGIEMLVGIVHNPAWGQVLAVGLGGIWVELLKDTSLRVLPVSREDVRAMLDELQGAVLLRGARGSKPADLEALVEMIYRISTLAQALRDNLEALEVNPLRVDGSQIEALDALITWRRS